jgi:hypothetical protein
MFKQTSLILFSRTLSKAINRLDRQKAGFSANLDSSDILAAIVALLLVWWMLRVFVV